MVDFCGNAVRCNSIEKNFMYIGLSTIANFTKEQLWQVILGEKSIKVKYRLNQGIFIGIFIGIVSESSRLADICKSTYGILILSSCTRRRPSFKEYICRWLFVNFQNHVYVTNEKLYKNEQ